LFINVVSLNETDLKITVLLPNSLINLKLGFEVTYIAAPLEIDIIASGTAISYEFELKLRAI
tara:strand:+ start:1333 stop:1518 length:186 start_codon:yes stop_codon:yes gene_type:complete